MPGAIIFPGTRPAPAPEKAKDEKETHAGGNSFGVVYVNSLAREALNAEPTISFPRGSVIVREKLTKVDDAQPQLLTVMIKRSRGFNPKANDWEFLMVDGTMRKILERQKKGSCLDCHASQKHQDFVYPTTGGVNSWASDENTREALETMLRENYPSSVWTAKLGTAQE